MKKNEKRSKISPPLTAPKKLVLRSVIIMSNNNNNNNNANANAMKRVERLKTHVVVSAAPLFNDDDDTTTTNNNNNFSVLERRETSFFSSPFGVRSNFVRVCLFFSSSLRCARFYRHPRSRRCRLSQHHSPLNKCSRRSTQTTWSSSAR